MCPGHGLVEFESLGTAAVPVGGEEGNTTRPWRIRFISIRFGHGWFSRTEARVFWIIPGAGRWPGKNGVRRIVGLGAGLWGVLPAMNNRSPPDTPLHPATKGTGKFNPDASRHAKKPSNPVHFVRSCTLTRMALR